MIPNKLQVKVFAHQSEEAFVPQVVPIFHRWITERVLDEVLVDVADYRHVSHGPGIMLVGHESNYHLDEQHGQLGLVCFRKRAFVAERDPLLDAIRRALFACAQIERELSAEGKLFNAASLKISSADRTATTPPFQLDEFASRVADKLGAMYQSTPELEPANDGNLPAVHVRFSQPHASGAVLERLKAVN